MSVYLWIYLFSSHAVMWVQLIWALNSKYTGLITLPHIYFRPYLPEISRKTYIHIYTYVIFLWFHSYTSGIPCIYWHKRRSGLVVPMMNQNDEKDITTTTTYSIGKSFPFLPYWTAFHFEHQAFTYESTTLHLINVWVLSLNAETLVH